MRQYELLQENWYFKKDADASNVPECASVCAAPDWQQISLPHTWNAEDGQDGNNDYYRGACWYVREFDSSTLKPGHLLYLEIEAASSACTVYLNGQKITGHEGGYSTFRADLTSCLQPEANTLALLVSNEPQEHIYPQMADFTFYGGLYRGVYLIEVPKTHFDLDYFGAEGMTASSEILEEQHARLMLNAFVTNPQPEDQIEFTVCNQEQLAVAEIVRPAESCTCAELLLTDVHLWHGTADPYLYTVTATLLRHNEVLDRLFVRHGFRTFTVDPQKGFFLNGELLPLRGVSRHQDRLHMGCALTYEDHLEDARLIKELGANTIRLAHYQHSQEFYDLCDEMGFIVWAEIPFISRMNPAPAAHEHCKRQMRELILQNYNHASICFWGISNEITIGGVSEELVEHLKELNELTHTLDPTRLTTMAQVSMLPMEDSQNRITDIVSYNHYFGWYVGSFYDNEVWLDAFHAMHPDRALGLSEYGCEGIITYHNDTPKAGDYSEEYQALYHEHMAAMIEERPWLWATHIWNMFDFGCDARDEGGVAGRNNKGLVTFDRQIKKDAFYLYKAYWSPEPFVHICSKRYSRRTNDAITVKVYSNLPEVHLYVDGIHFAHKTGKRIFEFEQVPLHEPFTTITVKSGAVSDATSFEKVREPFAPYTYVEEEGETGVTNWFARADLDKERHMTNYEGFYSIEDTVEELLKNETAADILVNAASSLTGMRIKKAMLAMMSSSTIRDIAAMGASDKSAEELENILLFINEQLQEVKK